ncbi:MAG: MATE family efflux transporter [Flavipsychrobacter sp.]
MSSRRPLLARTTYIIQSFKEALQGKEKEYTTGSINRAIFMLSVPMVLEMVMESLFAVVDVFFVGKLGVNAVATVGLTESVITLVYSVAIGLSMAATAMVARRIGEKKADQASHTGIQAIYVGIAFSAVIGLFGAIFAKDILRLMGADAELIAENYMYTRIMMGSNVVIMLLFLINGVFRGAGDASIAMRSLWLANGMNIILCPTLIYGIGPIPALGLTGAALATTIGRGIGVLYQLYHLFKGNGIIRILPKHCRIDIPIIKNVLKISAGGTAQFLINSASWIFLVRIVSRFGSDALAGYTIGIRVIIFTLLPAFGMANAAATLVGQNLGANQPDRAEKSVWKAANYNMLFLGIIAVVFFTFATPIIEIFTHKEQVVNYGVQCLRYISLGYIFYGLGMVLVQSFNGAGDTKTPTIINIFGFWVFQIPLAYVLSITFDLGPTGVFLAIAIAESVIATAAIVLFKKGKWKNTKV